MSQFTLVKTVLSFRFIKKITMKKIVLSLLLLLISTIGLSQGTNKKNTALSQQQLKVLANQQIIKMHNGALLVKLKTKKNSIATLRKFGKNQQADKIEVEQSVYNKKIINGFKANFDFCPTYFFYSDYSQEILDKQFDKVEFLNVNLQYDSTIIFNNTPFLTAEFGIIEQDTAKFFDGYYYAEGIDGLEKRKKYNGGTDMTFGALIIKNENFFQLSKPFPYYSRMLHSIPFKRKPKNVIAKMNRQLYNFYTGAN